MNPIPDRPIAERIASNQSADVLEDIVALCMNASKDANILIIEGLHADATHTFTSQLNIDIANSLKAGIVVVADGSLPAAEAIAEARLAVSQYVNEGCTVAGVVFNKAPEDFDIEVARVALGGTPLWGVVHETVALRAPRVRDVAEHLDRKLEDRLAVHTQKGVADHLAAIEGMVRSGLGLALMREEVATSMAAGGEYFIWPHVSLSSQMVFVYRVGDESSPATIGMISVLRKCWET